MVSKIKLGKKKKDFSTKRQIKKIISSAPDLERQAEKVTSLKGGI